MGTELDFVIRGNYGLYVGPLSSVVFTTSAGGTITYTSATHPAYTIAIHNAGTDEAAEFLLDIFMDFLVHADGNKRVFDFREIGKGV